MDLDKINAAHAELETALRNDNRVAAIKAVRALTGGGLREAKAVVDAMFAHITRIETSHEYRAPMPVQYEDNAPHVVCITNENGDNYVNSYEGNYDNRGEAMAYARSRVDCSNINVIVAKVIATTKRTLEVL